ncbi:gluconokinase, GntK/IdnK-type [Octadecabacter sp. G9-8]|uniref:Gluconokinase n=1 Tax=Octadecabacter dasysiphoniae TaxID=2909341 RepID=A0ABS9CZ41_9RHOB|nr:gluconokinase, GntK/IdnK-type [Octadecabacter dasysiphoniae]MCF2871665.1 gluconokinase, GntK/IdnK-type [Octadecabacter dasysiphoniae]
MVRVVVMGVAGSGKSTLGAALAEELGAAFVDADDLHSEDSITHMSAGKPLTDAMRWPWLDRCGAAMNDETDVVLACSALRRSYRAYLRAMVPDLRLVYPRVSEATVRTRMAQRHGHFMPNSLIKSQFETLEPPETDEQHILIPSILPVWRAAKLAARVLNGR